MKNRPRNAAPKWLGIFGAFAERLERMAPAQVRNADRVLGFDDKEGQISADALDQDPLQIWYYLDRYPKEKALAHVLPILVGYLHERGQHFPTLTMIAAWLDPKSDNDSGLCEISPLAPGDRSEGREAQSRKRYRPDHTGAQRTRQRGRRERKD